MSGKNNLKMKWSSCVCLPLVHCTLSQLAWATTLKGIRKTNMNEFYLEWQESQHGRENITYFSYAPDTGFRDVDFHPIKSDADWNALAADGGSAIAEVEVSSNIPVSELQKCVDLLSRKEHYKRIRFNLKGKK